MSCQCLTSVDSITCSYLHNGTWTGLVRAPFNNNVPAGVTQISYTIKYTCASHSFPCGCNIGIWTMYNDGNNSPSYSCNPQSSFCDNQQHTYTMPSLIIPATVAGSQIIISVFDPNNNSCADMTANNGLPVLLDDLYLLTPL